MAGRCEGVSALGGAYARTSFPPHRSRRGMGCRRRRCGSSCICCLEVLMTGRRWGAVPRGLCRASQRAPHRWLQRWQAEGTLAALPARMLGVAEARGLIRWADGAVDGACSPWPGGRRGRRPAEARPRACHPTPHRRGRAAWAHCPTPAQGMSAPQECRGSLRSGPPGQRGRPRQRLQVNATGKGDEAQAAGAAAQVWYPRPKRGWKTKQTRGRPNTSCHDAKPSARLPGFRRHPGGWGSAGSGWRLLCGVAGGRHYVHLDAQLIVDRFVVIAQWSTSL